MVSIMEKHILSLIKENNRVIIPNFGAFIVAKEKGFTILFNNFLSFNDGLLIDYVVSSEQLSKEEATQKVETYVERVKEELDTQGRYQIEGLGTFTKDNTGILRFIQSEDINDLEDSTDSEPELLDIDSSTKDSEEPKAEEKPVEETPVSASIKETPLVEVEEEAPKKEVISTPAPSPGTDLKDGLNDTKKTPSANEGDNKRNRSIFLFLIIFVLIPLIGAVIYFSFFNTKEPAKKVEEVKTVVTKTPEANETLKALPKKEGEIVAGPQSKKEDIKTEEKPAEVKSAVDRTKPHHIIVGSFKNMDNAERYLKSLKDKGYDQCTALQSNSMTLISIQSFDKLYKAHAMQEEILEKHRLESWILTKKK